MVRYTSLKKGRKLNYISKVKIDEVNFKEEM